MYHSKLPERRQFERRPADFPVRVSLRDGNGSARRRHRVQGRVLNISEKGVLLDLPNSPSTAVLDLDFRIPPGVFANAYVHRYQLSGRVVRSAANGHSVNGNGSQHVAVELDKSLDQTLRRTAWKRLRWLGVLLFFVALGNIIFLKLQNLEYFWYKVTWSIYSLGVTTYILSRFIISAFYRPPRDVGYRPSVTVIVAAKNEEAAIGKTIEKIFESNYPKHLLEVIAVDDGSTDGTYREMMRMQDRFQDLHLIRFAENRGKRHGMEAGARAARGDILVYVDSDSFLDRDAIRYLVQGFADPQVAAVAAHGAVANAWTNTLTRMQAVWYYLAFTVLKAAESVFSSVTCCSGCCAAYRRSAVFEVLDEWVNQKFMGRPATFGDDRSLTNFMLRKYKVLYDENARVETIVPDKYRQFFRQQLRWKKSWVRESFIAASFIWKKPPLMALSFYAGLIFPLIAPLVVVRALVLMPIFAGRPSYLYAWGVFLMSVLYSSYYLVRQRNRLWVYGAYFCLLYMTALIWQLPWAIATSWNNKWGTR